MEQINNDISLENINLLDGLSLTDDEKLELLHILSELKNVGNSDTLNGLYAEDYEEIPVDIFTFITDKRYLGGSLVSETGDLLVYKYWVDTLKAVFAPGSNVIEVCLSEDTKVKLLDGTSDTMRNLYDRYHKNREYLEVYSYDRSKEMFAPGKITNVMDNGTKPCYKITLDNGESFKCTSNHKIMLRSGEYKSIDSGLSVGDSLMPYRFRLARDTYKVLYNPKLSGKSKPSVEHLQMFYYKTGRYPKDGYHIHHKNINPKDNRTINLMELPAGTHIRFHCKLNKTSQYKNYLMHHTKEEFVSMTHQWAKDDPERAYQVSVSNLNKFNKELRETNPELHKKIVTENGKKGLISRWSDPSQRERSAIRINKLNNTKEFQDRTRYCKFLKFANNKILGQGLDLTESVYKSIKPRLYPRWEWVISYAGSYEQLLIDAQNYNHVIVDIEYVGDQHVYDLTVDNYHNFVLDCGVVVHNCFSGAIGVGKSTIACIGMAYILYKLLCLKNPAAFYNLTKSSRIALAIINLDLNQAYGVGYAKLQGYLLNSPWFLEHGNVYGNKNKTYYPNKDIDILAGSKMEHFIGRDVFCLDGDTEIMTKEYGVAKLKDLQDLAIHVKTFNQKTKAVEWSNFTTVKATKQVKYLVEIEFTNGKIVKSTLDHRFLKASGEYVEAKYLQKGIRLEGFNSIIWNVNITELPYYIDVYDVIECLPYNNFLVNIGNGYIVSHNCGFLDEMNFVKGQTDSLETNAVMKLYSTIKRRMESRFMKMGQVPGKLFMVSSKKSTNDFLELYINKVRSKPFVYIVDEPVWVIKNAPGTYSGKTFNVAVGNQYNKSKILADNEDPEEFRKNGQEVIAVPVEHREAFEIDINTSLMDIAGKALASSSKFMYYDKLKQCYRDYLVNPFSMNTFALGFDDDSKIQDYFIPERLSQEDINKPHFIHWDPSKRGDRTGLAMTTIIGDKEVKRLKSGKVFTENDLIHKIEFAIGIESNKGQEIPFYKIREFIFYLKYELGYNIQLVSADTFNSVDSLQQISLRQIPTKVISVDRTSTPYYSFKNAINEGRVIMPYIPELEKELLDLEEDKVKDKIDHPAEGCLPGWTRIATNRGDKRLDQLHYTDKVYTYDIQNQKIKLTNHCGLRLTKYVDTLYIITTNVDGHHIYCTDNHPILLSGGFYKEAKDIQVGDLLKSTENQFEMVVGIYILTSNHTPVYDIEVPFTHNFILSNGLVVHNSKDIADGCCGSITGALSYKDALVGRNNDLEEVVDSMVDSYNDKFDNWLLGNDVRVF